jgi:CP family cyanate transporter-like MFS transporter
MTGKQAGVYALVSLLVVSVSMRTSITSVVPLIETIREALDMSRISVSLLVGIPVLCMGAFAPFSTRFGLRWGGVRIVAVCLMFIALATAWRAAASSPLIMLTTSLVVGIGCAIAGPLLSGFIKQHYPGNSAAMIGLYTLGMGVGGVLGTGLVHPLMQLMNGSWKVSLSIWAIVPLIGLVMWMPLVRLVSASVAEGTDAAPNARLPVRNGRAWRVTAVFGLQSLQHYVLLTWLAPLSLEMGVDERLIGAVVMVYMGLQTAFSLLIAVLSNRYLDRRSWLMISTVILLAGLLPIGLLHGPHMPWIAAVPLGIGTGGLFSLSLTLPLDETESPEAASAWTAMAQASGFLLAGIGPAAAGAIRDISGHYQFAIAGLMALCLLMLGLIFSMKPATAASR